MRRAPARRGAFTLIELAVACALLTTIFLIIGRLMTRLRQAQDVAGQRRLASTLVENVMERTAASLRTRGQLPDMSQIEALARDVTGGAIQIDVQSADNQGLAAVTVTLSSGAAHESPVSLTAWLPAPAMRAEDSQ